VRILVAIADVDALVAKGTPVDDHARKNTTSVYTPARIFAMLPERLSTDLTSLNEGQDRLAVVVSYVVDADGALSEPDVSRARVHNHAKLAYDAVADWLDGKGAPYEALARVTGLDEQIRVQDRVAQLLRQKRHEEGALELETIEPQTVVKDGQVVDVYHRFTNRARQIIEDFMIAANGVTARFLDGRGQPVFRRVIRSPERWDRVEEVAAELGDHLPPDPDGKALAEFLLRRRAADPLRFPDLSLTIVKLLGSGEYAVQRPGGAGEGHFGLAVRDYAHSTAPNRRFPDLITQRLLKASLAGAPVPYSLGDLGALATHCTVQEDAANKVERQVRKSAAALFISSRVGEKFDAIVTGASDKGTWVRAIKPPVEGKLVRGAGKRRVGQRMMVKLVDTDVERGFIDFEPA
jgi:exoribonuclease-2